MNTVKPKIKSFTDLDAWRHGHALVINIFKCTEKFPKSEQFNLTSQLRRSAVSITSNVAEGFSRKTKKEKLQFYAISIGSLTELQNQLLVARDVSFLSVADFNHLAQTSIKVHKLVAGLVKSAQDKN